MKNIKGYKFIHLNMKSDKGNHTWEIGKWYKYEGNIILCQSGFHACRKPTQSLKYNYGNKWFIVEARGKIIDEKDDKFVASEMRLIKEIPIIVLKRWALWNAKQCLENYNKQYKDDNRISDCIKVCEDFLDGKATIKQLKSAELAARSAARSAAWSAAESARLAAWSAELAAELAAESAARSAAWSAARSAAWSAAESARLAAWSAELAAELAAESAARSAAWSAAESAAESAARSAAESAAWSAAESAANKELLRLIKEYTK